MIDTHAEACYKKLKLIRSLKKKGLNKKILTKKTRYLDDIIDNEINQKSSDEIESRVQKTLILAFGLLQNATSIEQFENTLKDSVIIFKSKYLH